MKEIMMYTHFYKDYPFVYSDWHTPLSNESNISTPICRIIPKHKKLNMLFVPFVGTEPDALK